MVFKNIGLPAFTLVPYTAHGLVLNFGFLSVCVCVCWRVKFHFAQHLRIQAFLTRKGWTGLRSGCSCCLNARGGKGWLFCSSILQVQKLRLVSCRKKGPSDWRGGSAVQSLLIAQEAQQQREAGNKKLYLWVHIHGPKPTTSCFPDCFIPSPRDTVFVSIWCFLSYAQSIGKSS